MLGFGRFNLGKLGSVDRAPKYPKIGALIARGWGIGRKPYTRRRHRGRWGLAKRMLKRFGK